MKGFEPLNVGSKFRCLTTWLHPICSPNLFLELVAPQVGFEPTTWRLTAVRSTTELLEIGDWTSPNLIKKKMWFNFKKTSFFEYWTKMFFWNWRGRTQIFWKKEKPVCSGDKVSVLPLWVFIYMMYTKVWRRFFRFPPAKKRAYSLMVRTRCS